MSQIKQPRALIAERRFPRAADAQVKATKRLSGVVRAGRWWEAVGALLVIAGLIAAIAGVAFGWLVLIVGFVVFIIGRFQ
jgi:membrane protein required for beta-lactamase induction